MENANTTKKGNKVIIQMPLSMFTDEKLLNLKQLVLSKENLIKKAFDQEELEINVTKTKVEFPWVNSYESMEELDAYVYFVTYLCQMAVKQNKITAKQKEVENEKYAMRCFLLRLGFIGDEHKIRRKYLLKNLKGSSSFRDKKSRKEEKENV